MSFIPGSRIPIASFYDEVEEGERGRQKKRHIICVQITELGRYSGPSGRAEGAGTARRAKSATKSDATELKGPGRRLD
jgi:hypothetical protein